MLHVTPKQHTYQIHPHQVLRSPVLCLSFYKSNSLFPTPHATAKPFNHLSPASKDQIYASVTCASTTENMVWGTSPGGCHLCQLIPNFALFKVIVNLHLPPRAIFSKLEKQTLTLSYSKSSGLLHPWVCGHSSVSW